MNFKGPKKRALTTNGTSTLYPRRLKIVIPTSSLILHNIIFQENIEKIHRRVELDSL